ncbi:MAG: hypothetical protein R3E01_19750 [Pirellulaceae bacterium]
MRDSYDNTRFKIFRDDNFNIKSLFVLKKDHAKVSAALNTNGCCFRSVGAIWSEGVIELYEVQFDEPIAETDFELVLEDW